MTVLSGICGNDAVVQDGKRRKVRNRILTGQFVKKWHMLSCVFVSRENAPDFPDDMKRSAEFILFVKKVQEKEFYNENRNGI